MVEIALATHAVGTFRMSFWKFGPTELRILLAVGTLQLMRSDFVTIAGTDGCCSTSAASSRLPGWCVTFVVVGQFEHATRCIRPSRCRRGTEHSSLCNSKPQDVRLK